MFPVDSNILVLGLLVFFATISSRLGARIGVPLLVVFVAIGMLAGSEGPGGIEFDDYDLAHAIGTTALILILFDGGLQTSIASIRRTAGPAGVLSTFGVLLTAGLVGLGAAWLLDIPLVHGLLLGSIIGSTDAAAVFATLRSGGLNLRPRLAATLEIESGSNDPMAVLLTVACLETILGTAGGPSDMALFLVQQLALGGLVGWSVGRGAVLAINRARLPAAGLYPMITLGTAFISFGTAAVSGGSGFLAVYITGIVLGNHRLVFQRGVRLFHDGLAWFGQIVMFVVLGLLSSPSQVQEEWPSGLLLAGLLMFAARPLAVALCLMPFRYDWREVVFATWAGLKGAVPIILGIYPLMFGVDHAGRIFDIVFFVVLVSALIQGWTLGPLARWLKVTIPSPPDPPVTVEVSSLQQVDADIVSYLVKPNARVANRKLKDLGLPAEMVVAMIVRGQDLVVPKGSTLILPGDHVYVTLRPSARWLLDHVFSPGASPLLAEPLRGSMTLAELEQHHGLPLPGERNSTLGQYLLAELGRPALRGDGVSLGLLRFNVLDVGRDGVPSDVRLDLDSPSTQAPAPAAKEQPG